MLNKFAILAILILLTPIVWINAGWLVAGFNLVVILFLVWGAKK